MSEIAHFVTHISLKLDGAMADDALINAIEAVTVESSLHLPDVATVTLRDDELVWVDSTKIKPGVVLKIEIEAGPERWVDIFEGEIVELEPAFVEGASVTVVVRAFDRRHRLARLQHARSFINTKDSDLFKKLAGEAGLQSTIDATAQVHEYVFQSNETNLTFIQRRAAALGMLVGIKGDTLLVKKFTDGPATATLQWGSTLSEFRPRLSTLGQAREVTARSWDPKTKKEVSSKVLDGALKPKVGVKESGGELVKQAFNLETKVLLAERSGLTMAQLKTLAEATADRRSAHFIEAEGVCSDPTVRAGATITIENVGKRFGGTYFVTAATYRYTAAGQSVEFHVSGLTPTSVLSTLLPSTREITAPQGLAVALVTDIEDPEKLGRVKVKFPWLTEEHASDWVRVASLTSGKDRGFYWAHEVNDEVLVGFEHGDIERPYVLGSLWNGVDKPPKAASDAISGGQVVKRLIRSRTGHEILLDDGDSGGITIKDKNGNQIKLEVSGDKLTISSKGDILFDTKANMTLKATGSISIEATGSGTLKATNLTVDGGPKTDVKGGVINLN